MVAIVPADRGSSRVEGGQRDSVLRYCRFMDEAIALREWDEGDLPVLRASMGDPEMTRFLGGPESADQLAARHARYVAMSGTGRGHMFVILVGLDRVPTGSVGYWDKEWRGEEVHEIGWSVLPPFQGRGIASHATALALEHARAEGTYRFVHAFPSIENAPSNGICRRLGFTFLEACDFEYPKGHLMRCNDWRFDLRGSDSGSGASTGTKLPAQ